MSKETQAQDAVAVAVAVANHTADVYYKTFAEGTEGYKRLEALVAEGKLTMEQIDVGTSGEGADAKVTWKRKQAKLSVPVPVLDSVLVDGAFSVAQVAHLQSVLNKYFEEKQRPYVDAVSDVVVNWAEVLEGPYNQKKAAVKITAEMVTAGVLVLAKALEAIANAKVTSVVVEMAKKKFSGAVTRTVDVGILEKINGLVVEAFDTLDAEAQATHQPVFELWIDALGEAINPPAPEDTLSLDDFNM